MKNRVTVNVAGQEYNLVAVEDDAYIYKVAAHVDAQIRQVMDSAKLSVADSAVLTAMNIADAYFKEVETAENLRRQLKEYLDDSARIKLELSEAKREIFRLQNKK